MHSEQAGVLCRTLVQIDEGKYSKHANEAGRYSSIGTSMKAASVCPQGLGTTDSVLIRTMVARAEVDMLDIKVEFLKMYGKTLYSFIKVRDKKMHVFNI